MKLISLSDPSWLALLKGRRRRVGNILNVVGSGSTKFTVSAVSAICRLGTLDPERNKPLRAVLSKVGITTVPQLATSITSAMRAARKSMHVGDRDGFGISTTALFSPRVLAQIHKIIAKYYILESGKYSVVGPVGPGMTKIANPQSYIGIIAYSMCVVYSFVTLKLCTFYKLDPAKYKLPILMYLMFGKPSPDVPPKIRAMLGKELRVKGDSIQLGSELSDLKLEDVTPELLAKYGHELVDRLPKLFDNLVKKLIGSVTLKPKSQDPVRPPLPPSPVSEKAWSNYYKSAKFKAYDTAVRNREMAERYNKILSVKNLIGARDLALSKIHPEVAALLALTNKKANRYEWGYDEAGSRRWDALRLELKKVNSLIDKANQDGTDSTPNIKRRDSILKEIDSIRTSGASDAIKPWMLPFLPDEHKVKALLDKGVVQKIGKGLLTHMLVDKANKGLIRKGDQELRRPLDSADAQLLSLGALSNIIEDGYSGKSAVAFRHVFRRVVDVVKGKVFALALLSKKIPVKSLDTQLGVVDNKRLLRLNRYKDTDIDSLISQNRKTVENWDPTTTDVKLVADTIKEKARRETTYVITKVDAQTIDSWNKEVRQYMTGKHNVDVRVEDGWTVKISAKAQALLENLDQSRLEVVQNVFHGTAKQTGGIILTYGFKIRGTQVTARSMGNVLYLAPNIDKSAQYLSPKGGWTRNNDTVGIIFMGDAILDRLNGLNANSRFGWTRTDRFQTEEIGLVNPNAQFVIRRVFLVRIEHHGSTKGVSGSDKFNKAIPISRWLAEWKANNG